MTTNRQELLRLLARLSEEASDLRMGQLVANRATLDRGAEAVAIWNAEDEQLLAAAKRLLDHYRQRNAGAAQ